MSRSGRVVVAFTALAVGAASSLLSSCVFPSPSPGTLAALVGVASIDAKDAWAVGSFRDVSGTHDLMEHWDGKTWQEVWLPTPVGAGLTAITAVSASNVWAVDSLRTLHFDGSKWHSLPNPAGTALFDVASGADGAVYGLGKTTSGYSLLAMTPSGWQTASAFPYPSDGSNCIGYPAAPTDLAVVSTGDVWVIGNKSGTGANSRRVCPFTFRWNGLDWRENYPPQFDDKQVFAAVSARSDDDVWVVGTNNSEDTFAGGNLDHSLAFHWNGHYWGTIPAGFGSLNDVDATGDGVWAVGVQRLGAGLGSEMLIEKFNNANEMVHQTVQRIAEAPTSQPHTPYTGELRAVSVRDGVVTSVGDYAPSINVRATLTERRATN